MSLPIDYTYADYIETLRVAATEHTCEACKEPILAGHRYYDIQCVVTEADDPDEDDEVEEYTRCLRCQKLHEHLRSLSSDMWPDERLMCGEEYEDHWGKPPPPEIAELAFKTAAELQEQET